MVNKIGILIVMLTVLVELVKFTIFLSSFKNFKLRELLYSVLFLIKQNQYHYYYWIDTGLEDSNYLLEFDLFDYKEYF